MNLVNTMKQHIGIKDSKAAELSYELSVLLLGVCTLFLLSQIRVQLPWTPVPITGQSLGVLCIASAYGFKRGIATVLSYIALGAFGFPVFAGPASGMSYLLGATGGYLLGFVAAAAIIGLLVDHTSYFKQHRSSLMLFFMGHAIIFSFGALILSQFVGWAAVWAQGIAPFLPGAVFKTLVATATVPTIYKFINR